MSHSVRLSKFSHVTLFLHKLHWLPIQYRILFKYNIITYKAIHLSQPPYRGYSIGDVLKIHLFSESWIAVGSEGVGIFNREEMFIRINRVCLTFCCTFCCEDLRTESTFSL